MSKSSNLSSAWGTLAVVLMIAVIVGGVRGCNALVDKLSVKSVEKQGQIVLEFEQELYAADKAVTDLGKKVEQEILNFGDSKYVNIDLLLKAEDDFANTAKRISDIPIRKGLTKDRQTRLESIRRDFEYEYKAKSNAMFYFANYLADHNTSDFNDFMTNSQLAQNSMMDGVSEMAFLKKELGILEQEVTTES